MTFFDPSDVSVHNAPGAGNGSHFHNAMQLLARRGGRARAVASGLVLAAAANEAGRKLHAFARERTEYQVAVPGEDEIYDDVQAWLVENLPARRRRALTARSSRRRPRLVLASPGEDDAPPAPAPPPLYLAYDGSRSQTVQVDGHRIRVNVERDDRPTVGRLTAAQMDSFLDPRERIVFRMHGTAARDAVLGFLASLSSARNVVDEPRTRFYMASRWGDAWRRRGDLPTRSLDTVVLRAGQQEDLVEDLARFFADEPAYARCGLPWHRGYLLHGPPGTGKTSVARALAEHFKLDAYYVPLSDLDADTNLLGLLAQIEARAMLVLEDVDVVHAAKSRDDAEAPKRISLSGLLNALDGLATPHGLITVMTTNDKSVLDPALVRPGRVDRVEELGYLDDDQLGRLVELVLGRPPTALSFGLPSINGTKITHAEIIEAAKPYLGQRGVRAESAIAATIRKAGA